MIRVFIADDELIEVDFLTSLILENPDRFILSGSTTSSIDIIPMLEKSRPDVVVLDIRMPLKSGIEIARIINEKWPEILIIFNSAYADFTYAQKAIETGASAYLLKPARAEEFLSTIEKCYYKRFPEKRNEVEAVASETNPVTFIKDYIDRHYREEISLQQLSEYVHFNMSYLSKIFSQQQGITIREYIIQKRMEHAAQALRSTNLPIKLIVEDCGYETISQFYKVFKKYYNCTPAEYRSNEDMN